MPPSAPPRLTRPSAAAFALAVAALAFLVVSFQGAQWSFSALSDGGPALWRFLSRAFPPDLSRLSAILTALVETFQMALVGTIVGVALSVPLAVLASRRHAPHLALYALARGLIAFFRTVPDLIWALVFVIVVGLGPFAGTLAIAVDTVGFCGRFFAEAMEETDAGPETALKALGASRAGVLACAVFPAAMPAFVNVSLFALEKAVRSSVVLGLVGAGGIGIELKVAMDLFRFDQAATIILAIFILILAVEQVGARIRMRLI